MLPADLTQVPAHELGTDRRLLNCTPITIRIGIGGDTITVEPSGFIATHRSVAIASGSIGSIHAVLANGKVIPLELLPPKETIVFCT